jgi:DNA-binding LacI/PurR family transcriptional regulator
MRPATINDVAEKAGVSKATVSHVLNNTRFVHEDTRNRVKQVIEDLHYQPSMAARSLNTKRSETIGVIIPDMLNPIFGKIFQGIEQVFRPLNYSLIMCNTNMIYEREEYYIEILLRQRVEGIIAAAISKRWDVLSKVDALHIPIVFVDRGFDDPSYPFVGVDNRGGAKLGTQQLINCGHRKIGILAGPQHVSSLRDRLVGFQETLSEHQIPLPQEWIITTTSPEEVVVETGRQAALKLLSLPDRPTAIFINSNILCLGAMIAIDELGLRCPQDIAVVSFDDEVWNRIIKPPLTCVRQPGQEVGRTAAQTLISMINGWPLESTQIHLPCELVLRQSCCLTHNEASRKRF